MAVPTVMSDLSTTAASNSPAGSEAPISTDDFHRAIQAILRHTNAKGSDIASATTTNIGAATGEFVDVTGTTTITGLGTIAAGIERTVRFTGALTLTHNGTSLILPGGANITTAANDTAIFRSLGSGNWLCIEYKRQSGLPIALGGTASTDISVPDEAYDATNWNSNLEVPTKNAVRDKIVAMDAAAVTVTGNQSIDGNKTFSGNVLLSGANSLGYTAGAGGAVTQATSKSTGVTLNTPTGRVTMHNASLANSVTASFTLTNSFITAKSVLVPTFVTGSMTAGGYIPYVEAGVGSAVISIRNVSGGALAEAVQINFVVLSGETT